MSSFPAAIPLALHHGDLPRLRPLLPRVAAIWDQHVDLLSPGRPAPITLGAQVTPFSLATSGDVPVLVIRLAGALSPVALAVWSAASPESMALLTSAGIAADALLPVGPRGPKRAR